MSKTVFITIMCLLSLTAMAQKKDKTKEKVDVIFSVPMDCQGCVDKINKHMAFEKGVKGIKCNLEQKTVKITYRKDQTNIDKLKKGFAEIGYKNVKVVAGN